MGDYLVAADVWEILRRQQIGASVDMDDDYVETKIASSEADVNAALVVMKYSLPITAPSDISLIKGYIEYWVAAQVWSELHQTPNHPDFIRLWIETYQEWLKALRKGQTSLKVSVPAARLETQLGTINIGLNINQQ